MGLPMRRPFQIAGRAGWSAEVEHKDGRSQRRHFPSRDKASAWLHEAQAAIDAEFLPALGGPAAVTLGRMLVEYAGLYTINKGGWNAELTRLNHYIRGAGLKPLRVEIDSDGKRRLLDCQEKLLPKGFAAHRDQRLLQRERTYALIARLGARTVARITARDMQELASTMRSDALSESTIQKEIAVLKHAFNEAIRVWGWSLLRNPCVGIRLGRSEQRFVALSQDDQQRLATALSECDNPQFWPLCELAIASMLRRGSLLQLSWSQIDLDAGIAHVWTKGRTSNVPLSPRAIAILRQLKDQRDAPRSADDHVFSMSANGVNMAWEGVRKKADLPHLQFRDLRHLGATFYARVLNAHELRQALAHRTTAMAEVYVNIARSDVSLALARAEEQLICPRPMPRSQLPNGLKKLPRSRRRDADLPSSAAWPDAGVDGSGQPCVASAALEPLLPLLPMMQSADAAPSMPARPNLSHPEITPHPQRAANNVIAFPLGRQRR